MTKYTNWNIPLVKNYEDSQFRKKWRRRCQNTNHEDEDNHRMETFLVLEWNNQRQSFIDKNPEYWCRECCLEDCDI